MQKPPEDQLNAGAEDPLKPVGQCSPPPGHPGPSPPCPGKIDRGWFVQRRQVVYLSGVAADAELVGAVRAALRGAAQPELARPMQAYMKSATPFLGVRVPMMRTLTRGGGEAAAVHHLSGPH